MPVRLYRNDAYLRRFTAALTSVEKVGANTLAVGLDETAFYPTGGGQPHDTGHLGGLPVIDVREAQEGRILHIVEGESLGEAADVGNPIEGVIDWDRRFDHMQQHSGQHVLSRALIRTSGAVTRSFHLGANGCTIDVAESPSMDQIREAERIANDIVFADTPVTIESVDAASAGTLAQRAEIVRELALKPGDPIRMIVIGDFDETPCGGTHVRRTGEIGAIGVRSAERFKGGTRITFHCGRRVVSELGRVGDAADRCVSLLSAPIDELPDAISSLQAQLSEARRSIRGLTEQLAATEAVSLEAEARSIGSYRVVARVFEGRGAEELTLLARRYVEGPSRIALLAGVDRTSGKTGLVFARSGDPTEEPSMHRLLGAIGKRFGGRGGGRPNLARGGGLPEDALAEALAEAVRMIEETLARADP